MNRESSEEPGQVDPLTYAMDRADIWKAAHSCFTSAGWNVGSDYTVADVLSLAKFLAGDHIQDDADDIRAILDD